MKDRYLEITFRKGKPLAAYLYLTGRKGVQCVKATKIDEGLIADYDQNDVPVGLEIVSPATASVQQIKDALEKLHVEPISEDELDSIGISILNLYDFSSYDFGLLL